MGQVDFLDGQVAFKAYLLPKGQGFRKSPSNKIIDYDQQEVGLGKYINARAAGPKDKLEFTFIFSPVKVSFFEAEILGSSQRRNSHSEFN